MTWAHVISDWILTITVCSAAVLQFASARTGSSTELVRAGRALLAGGWILCSGWILVAMLSHNGPSLVPLPTVAKLWLAILSTGTVFVTIYRIVEEVSAMPGLKREDIR
jgi:hypothetical protein